MPIVRSHAVYLLEDLSVSAFRNIHANLGANEFVSVCSGIMGAEAYYAGAVRWRLSDRLAVATPWNQQPVWQVLNALSAWRQKLSGGCVHTCMLPSARVHARTASADSSERGSTEDVSRGLECRD